jgi:hypothetical protein
MDSLKFDVILQRGVVNKEHIQFRPLIALYAKNQVWMFPYLSDQATRKIELKNDIHLVYEANTNSEVVITDIELTTLYPSSLLFPEVGNNSQVRYQI